MAATLSARFLIEGAFFAAHHSRNLLGDAVNLYKGGRYSTSLVLSTYCIEELGRAKILHKNARDAFNGMVVTVESIRKKCRNHKIKLGVGREFTPGASIVT